jgi:hypothetical protein
MRWKEIFEAQVSAKYIDAINQILSDNGPLAVEPKSKSMPGVAEFLPNQDQQINSLDDILVGVLNGHTVEIPARWIHKSSAIKNLHKGKGTGELDVNKGEVAEGFHAVAAFARLIKRPSIPITVNDVIKIINRIDNNKLLILKKKEIENDIADEFHLTVALKPGSWAALKDPRTIEEMGKIFTSIITDANQETSKFADRFATNQRFDRVRVIGDGVSEESLRKTDVRFENESEKKFADFSLKVGTTPQIHQVGGGKKTASAEERFEILQNNLFNVDGRFPLADISFAKTDFVRAKTRDQAQEIAYKAAVRSLNANLRSDDQEKSFLQNLVGALKYWAARTDPNVKLKQFTTKGTMILDINRIDQLLADDQLDLYAYYDPGATPRIVIGDSHSGKDLVVFRTKRSENGYLRNYIEKGKLFVDLTLAKFIPNTPPKVATPPLASVKKAPAKPALAVSKPKIGAPVAPKGTIGTTPAPQTGIRPIV